MIFERFEYDPEDQHCFRTSRKFRRDWAARYPTIFDEGNLRCALNQSRNHFYEWSAAISYAQQGYRVIVGKYHSPGGTNHGRYNVFESVAPAALVTYLLSQDKQRSFGNSQGPDLFVYKGRQWFFVEVKGQAVGGRLDRLRPRQREFFEAIEHYSGQEIRIVHALPKEVVKVA